MSIHEEVGELSTHHREFRMAVEGMRNALEGVKLNGHARFTKLLNETLATFDGNRRVFHAMENRSWRKP